MNLLSIAVPSINRPQLLGDCLSHIYRNVGDVPKEVIVVTEDIETMRFLDANFPRIAYPDMRVIWNNQRLGYMAAWNECLKHINGDIFLPIGDDGFLQPGALQQVLDVHQGVLKGYGVVGFDDGYIPQEIVCTHFLMDVGFIKKELGGVMLTPHYKAFFADNELNDRAKRVNRLTWVKRAYIMHEHSSRGKRPIDEIDRQKTDFWEHDEVLYGRRKQQNFPNDFEPII